MLKNFVFSLNQQFNIAIYTPQIYAESRLLSSIKNYRKTLCGIGCLPNSICGTLQWLCEYLKVLLCTIYIFFRYDQIDLIILDQFCILIPLLRLKTHNLIFLSNGETLIDERLISMFPRCLQRILSTILDIITQLAASMATKIIVDSVHNQKRFMKNHKMISAKNKNKQKDIFTYKEMIILRKHSPHILYNAVDFISTMNAISTIQITDLINQDN